jgi:hypothetical protein
VPAYREAFKAEREKHGSFKMNPRIPEHTAAGAVLRVRPDLNREQAARLAHQATAWTAQAHWKWFWAFRRLRIDPRRHPETGEAAKCLFRHSDVADRM